MITKSHCIEGLGLQDAPPLILNLSLSSDNIA